jgi:L-alanine-DL-glutamate epimerase-like enolase superfamily enzyme
MDDQINLMNNRSTILRRDFLAAAATALPAVMASSGRVVAQTPSTAIEKNTVKIASVEVMPARYPMTGYFKFFSGADGIGGRGVVFVKVTADDGTVGWGQSVPIARWSYETLETATVVLRDYFAPAVIGIHATDMEAWQAALDGAIATGFSTGMPISRAGLDLALHDLAGKLQNQSLAQLWGRERGEPLTLSWTLNPQRLDEVDTLIDDGWNRGYRNFNIKVAPDPKFDVELAQLVRKRVPEGFLWADANGGYDVATALNVAPKLADAGVDVLEAPLKPNLIRGYQSLRRQSALPILMDEGVVSPVELAEFIHLKMIDGVAMKPSRCGGLESARQQIELLENEGLMWLGSGLTDPDISLSATVGLYAAYGLSKPAALNGPQFLTADVSKEPLSIHDGKVEVPRGPGLGIEVDETKVMRLVI